MRELRVIATWLAGAALTGLGVYAGIARDGDAARLFGVLMLAAFLGLFLAWAIVIPWLRRRRGEPE